MALNPLQAQAGQALLQGQPAQAAARTLQGLGAVNGGIQQIHVPVVVEKGAWESFKDWCSHAWKSFTNMFSSCCKAKPKTPANNQQSSPPAPINAAAVPGAGNQADARAAAPGQPAQAPAVEHQPRRIVNGVLGRPGENAEQADRAEARAAIPAGQPLAGNPPAQPAADQQQDQAARAFAERLMADPGMVPLRGHRQEAAVNPEAGAQIPPPRAVVYHVEPQHVQALQAGLQAIQALEAARALEIPAPQMPGHVIPHNIQEYYPQRGPDADHRVDGEAMARILFGPRAGQPQANQNVPPAQPEVAVNQQAQQAQLQAQVAQANARVEQLGQQLQQAPDAAANQQPELQAQVAQANARVEQLGQQLQQAPDAAANQQPELQAQVARANAQADQLRQQEAPAAPVPPAQPDAAADQAQQQDAPAARPLPQGALELMRAARRLERNPELDAAIFAAVRDARAAAAGRLLMVAELGALIAEVRRVWQANHRHLNAEEIAAALARVGQAAPPLPGAQ